VNKMDQVQDRRSHNNNSGTETLTLSNVVVELVDRTGVTRAVAKSLTGEHYLKVVVFDSKSFIAKVDELASPSDTQVTFFSEDGAPRHSYIYHSWGFQHELN